MNVLVVNAGSSTLKYQVIDTKSHKVSAKGSCERVCFTGGTFTHAANGSKKVTENIEFPDHKVAIEVVLKDLEANGVKIEGIGHRIVQGGWYFGDSSLVDEDVLAKIREVAPLAPLHNNPEANVIEYCLEQYPDLPNVTVYDTAFHFNMPEVAKTYALPKDVCDKLHIRKYGAHGTSYRYISKKVAEMTNGEARKVVVCHIGSGASLCAIEDGKCMDTTMGLDPARRRHDGNSLRLYRPGYRVLPAARGWLHLRRGRRDDEQEVRPFGCDRRQDQRLPQRRGARRRW